MPTLTISTVWKKRSTRSPGRAAPARRDLAAGEKIVSKCGGEAKCGECHVFVQEGRKSVSENAARRK